MLFWRLWFHLSIFITTATDVLYSFSLAAYRSTVQTKMETGPSRLLMRVELTPRYCADEYGGRTVAAHYCADGDAVPSVASTRARHLAQQTERRRNRAGDVKRREENGFSTGPGPVGTPGLAFVKFHIIFELLQTPPPPPPTPSRLPLLSLQRMCLLRRLF